MEKPRSEVVNNEDVESLEQFVRNYREGKVRRGVILTYETDDGRSVHKIIGDYADDLAAAASQVARLDVALNCLSFCSDS